MRIIHTVVFRLRHDEGSPAETAFLSDATRTLSAIPAVNDFAVRRQVSSKSDARFQFSMTFDDQASYDAYNTHPITCASSRRAGCRKSPRSRSTTSST